MAKNGKSVVVISCHDDIQAHECEKALSYDKGMKYIKTCYGQKPQIKNAAHIKELDFLKCPRWNKEYMFSLKKDDINENTIRKIVAESVKKVLKEEGEGIEAMGSAPSEGYGKHESLMYKLDEEGNKEIEFILQKNGMLNGRNFTSKSFTSEMVYSFLQQLKSSMIRQLDTRY